MTPESISGLAHLILALVLLLIIPHQAVMASFVSRSLKVWLAIVSLVLFFLLYEDPEGIITCWVRTFWTVLMCANFSVVLLKTYPIGKR